MEVKPCCGPNRGCWNTTFKGEIPASVGDLTAHASAFAQQLRDAGHDIWCVELTHSASVVSTADAELEARIKALHPKNGTPTPAASAT